MSGLDHQTLMSLRRIAEDEVTQPKTRLSAIDAVAAASNAWGTQRFPIREYSAPTERGRKWLRSALRKLLKTKKPMAKRMRSSIHSRLLVLKGVILDFNNKILRPPLLPDGSETPITPKIESQPVEQKPKPVDPKVAELQAFIASVEEKNNGTTN